MKAKTQGKLDLETVSAGSRFCFSSLKATGVKTKRPTSVLLAEDEDLLTDQLAEGESFADVEAFLADYGQGDGAEDAVSETDAAEALAVSWKEKRSEINRLQKSRQFHAADASRRNFRIEFEELKKRTRRRKCGRIGHWARECRSKPQTSASAPPGSSSQGKTAAETLFVETQADLGEEAPVEEQVHFVGAAEEALSASLVSSPGFGVIDSGCGKHARSVAHRSSPGPEAGCP